MVGSSLHLTTFLSFSVAPESHLLIPIIFTSILVKTRHYDDWASFLVRLP